MLRSLSLFERSFLKESFGKLNFKGQVEGGFFKGRWKYLLDLKGKSKKA